VPPLSSEQVLAWGDYQEAPWGRLRLDLIHEVLGRHLPSQPRRVLDAGCGLGELAVELARSGSEVVAADASEPMLTEAERRAGDSSVRWVAVEVERAAERFADERFDLVLCHNVLGYVADPATTCASLATLLEPGGMLSLTVLNRAAEPLRQAFLLRDLEAGLAAAENEEPKRRGQTLGIDSRQEELEDATGWLTTAGLEPVAAAGLLLVNHFLGAHDETNRTAEGYEAVRRLELALCERDPYRQVAPLLQLIGRRPA
jgi:S-adenosylmethionine-dependent methyltransferase